jgi:hypothetical protein
LCFIITAGEAKQAQEDGQFRLVVVTAALTSSPRLNKFSGQEFCRLFKLLPIQYRALPKN